MKDINKELSTILRKVVLFDEKDKLETELIENIKELFKDSVPLDGLVMPKIADLQKQNSKLIALLQMRDGGDHDNDCKANYGIQCNCGHNAVKLYFDSNFTA